MANPTVQEVKREFIASYCGMLELVLVAHTVPGALEALTDSMALIKEVYAVMSGPVDKDAFVHTAASKLCEAMHDLISARLRMINELKKAKESVS